MGIYASHYRFDVGFNPMMKRAAEGEFLQCSQHLVDAVHQCHAQDAAGQTGDATIIFSSPRLIHVGYFDAAAQQESRFLFFRWH
jgi:hypothetical protein